MEDNVLEDLKKALDDLSGLLDQDAVKQALNLIPNSLLSPVVEGLKTVLGVIKDALNEIKSSLESIGGLDNLFSTVTGLLDAAEGLAPGESETIGGVKKVVKTLQDLPGLEDIENIMAKIDEIVTKLDAIAQS